ncbi:NAD(P)/FAD-dependent oxidoreductase [Terrihabitans rhizophilus]|uniref:NAD(P)/FAD-dependent oxidoreductase n=1 Tax=Terrihabitans rhizophilus TaxID=3092662 RepID=A0ABU4RLF6_9HYPH|nr:NAD(P)/FAD-dependent oxidoreductase [Terrihabitans sp. PJ23]MDX6805053.1 NAD(P)/FAD-dependent oxidoreductase [Terrihabitans sp. PJ23]
MIRNVETLVVGAGPAGLSAAYLLAREGREVVVLEQDPVHVGGISRSVDYKGFLLDIGGHRFVSKSEEVVDLWNEILPEGFIERPQISRIFHGGKFYSYPLKAVEALRNLGVVQGASCMLSHAWARLRPIPQPRTFHERVRNQYGERFFSIFFRPYVEKVWRMSCDDVSPGWMGHRIKAFDPLSAFRAALGLKPRTGEAGKSFRYPRRGPGMVWEAAAEKIRARGGRVLLGRKLERLTWNDKSGSWTVTARLANGEVETFIARNVVSSAPIRDLVDLILPKPISLLHARELRYRDLITVALIARSDRDLFEDTCIHVHDPSLQVGRVLNFRAWSPELVPHEGYACFGLQYFCLEEDGLWSADDSVLVDLAKREMAAMGLAPQAVVDACVVRQPKAYPVYDEFYAGQVRIVQLDLETTYPTLHLVGRNGMHRDTDHDHAVLTAMLTARNIIAGRRIHDVWAVDEDARYVCSGTPGESAAPESERPVPRRAA